ncbi:MAG: hypothetical protein ACR2JK_00230 [Geodermatophilaceae bacterium]
MIRTRNNEPVFPTSPLGLAFASAVRTGLAVEARAVDTVPAAAGRRS